jgi:hypothetical protein
LYETRNFMALGGIPVSNDEALHYLIFHLS